MSGPFGSSQWMYNASSGLYGFEITNSLRFNDNDSAYLTRTHSSGGDRQTWTWSGWVKRGNIASDMVLFSTRNSSNDRVMFYIHSSGTLEDLNLYLNIGGTSTELKTNRVFRDSSAWYHMMVHVDTTQGTASNRAKMYVNGEQITSFATGTYPTQNASTAVNLTNVHYIGVNDNGNGGFYDGYLADVNFIDGAALTPSSFGETKNDIWIPKDTSGLTFGTTGFRLEFKQTGTGTASSSTIGADTSGNDNHWTSNSLVASDVVPDSPTNNFATLNPLDNNGSEQWSEGNLKWYSTTSDVGITRANFAVSSGKWYWEINLIGGSRLPSIGIADQAQAITADQYYVGQASSSYGYFFNGKKYNNASSSSYGSTYTTGDIISVAFNADNGQLTFYKNGTSQGVAYTVTSGKSYAPALGKDQTSKDTTSIVNFGQDSSFAGNETAQGNADENGIGDFYYAPPSGFLALCTANLPDPVATVDPAKGGSPQDYFNTVLYSGDDGTQAITGVGFQPDWVWIKSRNHAYNHNTFDSVRGVNKVLLANTTAAEDAGGAGDLNSFDTDGFTVRQTSNYQLSDSGKTYVAWNWKAGTSFSNDASATGVGNVDSTGSVNTDVGFSIIAKTNTGNDNQTVAHGLGVAPDLIIVKNRSTSNSWVLGYNTAGFNWANDYIQFDTGGEKGDGSGTVFGAAPTSTVFTTGSGINGTNGVTQIAYCFASVDGFSKVGSYTGNGNADGPFVYLGFRPAFVILKGISANAGGWMMYDNTRIPYNLNSAKLIANISEGENANAAGGSSLGVDFLSNGFKHRNDSGTNHNTNGNTYIYMAFAEQPFKYANAR